MAASPTATDRGRAMLAELARHEQRRKRVRDAIFERFDATKNTRDRVGAGALADEIAIALGIRNDNVLDQDIATMLGRAGVYRRFPHNRSTYVGIRRRAQDVGDGPARISLPQVGKLQLRLYAQLREEGLPERLKGLPRFHAWRREINRAYFDRLTDRWHQMVAELEWVARHVFDGKSVRDIAEEFGVGKSTVHEVIRRWFEEAKAKRGHSTQVEADNAETQESDE